MRKGHDRLSKLVLEEILEPAGQVAIEMQVPLPDSQGLDVWFVPRRPLPRACPRYLRLPYRMVRRPCGIEPFSRTPQAEEVQDCQCKQLVWHRTRRRQARSKGQPRPALYPTWIITPGRPRGEFVRRRVQPATGWPPGVYCTDPGTELWFVVVSELPRTPETLLLRLLGSNKSRLQALEDLQQWPRDDPDLAGLRALVVGLLQALERDKNILREVKETIMTAARKAAEKLLRETEQKGLKEGLKEGRHEGLKEGRHEGLKEGRQESLLLIYKNRLGRVPAWIRAAVLAISDEARLQSLFPLFLRGTKQDIASALQQG